MTDTPPPRSNPYPGPRAFQRGESLYGRDREVMELLDLLIAERIVLLYSPSGAGKTSLIQATLIPQLEAEGFQVLPIMRVSLEPPPAASQPAAANRYVASLLLSLEEALPPEQQTLLAELTGLTLGDYLDRRGTAADGADSTVLILDQFEEVLTVNPTDRAAKAEFFAQVGAALRDRQRWALFAMREEYIAGLDPYLPALPTRLSTTYRLDLLGVAEAKEAMQKPARAAGVKFTTAAADRLAGDLAAVRIQQPDGSTASAPGDYVEPVQLQVVCRRLWDRLMPGDDEIGTGDVEGVGDVDAALRGYYADQVAGVAAQTGVGERAIREWVERQLITEQGIRGQVLQGPEQSQGLDNRAIWPLVDAHLVRAEKRRGATWFELAHDRLIEPVRADNAAWRQIHLSPLQRQAALWKEQGEPDGLLLRGPLLTEAEAWAAGHGEELGGIDQDFLAACRQAQAIARREEKQRRYIGCLAWVVLIFGIVAIGLGIYANFLRLEAKHSLVGAQTAEAQALSEAAARATAEQQAVDSQATVAVLLEAMLALRAPTATATPTPTRFPGVVPVSPTVVPELSPTPTATPTPQPAATVAAEATIQAVATQFARVQATQTALASAALSPMPQLAATAAAEATRQAEATQAAQVQATQTAMAQAARPPLPTGAQIVFVSTRQGGSNLFVVGVDGEGQGRERPARQIPLGPCDVFFNGCFEAGRPAFQPGTGRFIFQARVPKPGSSVQAFDIFLAELANGRAIVTKNLTDSDWDQMDGTWSPDGRQVAFLSTYQNLNRIWLMRGDGTGQEPLTSGQEYKDEQPVWSPVGGWIAVSAQKAGSEDYEIYLIDPTDGTKRQPVTNLGGVNRVRSWSPDGRRLAFGRGQTVPEDICVINRNGSGLRCHETPWPEDMPAWSPDGNWIAFHRNVDDKYRTEIFVMRADFSEEYRLTYNEAEDRMPVWLVK